jgi:FkbM family methyltransferase
MLVRKEQLSFIQVGANDGVYDDPLRGYVQRFGWRGLLVEPQPDVFARLVENYRDHADHLIFENIAISPVDREVSLYRVPGLTAVAGQKMQDALTVTSMNPKVVAHQGGVLPGQLEQVVVPAMRLDDLIERHQMFSLDSLQIDCEGYDGEVLKSIDLNLHRPRLIQFEHGHMKISELVEIEQWLDGHGYRLLYGGRQVDSIAMPEISWQAWPRPCRGGPGHRCRRRWPEFPVRPRCAGVGCT